MMNILNGGAHADTNVDIQEFMIAPIGAATFREALRWGAEVYHALKARAEGARAVAPGSATRAASRPNLPSNRAALDLIAEAVEQAGYTLGTDIALALDVAATEFHADGAYTFEGKAPHRRADGAYYAELVARLPARLDRGPARPRRTGRAGSTLTDALGDQVQIVGDDLFVTNPERLARGIASRYGQRAAGQGQPDRHADRDPRRGRRWPTAAATAA